MKKSIIAALAAVLTLGACQQTSPATAPAASNGTGISIATVNLDSIQKKSDLFVALSEEFAAEEAKLMEDLQKRQEVLQANIMLYQQEASKMSEAQRQANEADLQRVQQNYMMVEQQAQQSLLARQQELQGKFAEVMESVIDDVQAELGVDYIVTTGLGDDFLYTNPDHDITDKVLEAMNSLDTEEEEAADQE